MFVCPSDLALPFQACDIIGNQPMVCLQQCLLSKETFETDYTHKTSFIPSLKAKSNFWPLHKTVGCFENSPERDNSTNDTE